ncbi:MAG: hypothetical protein JO134_09900 [Xanthobacteraceae bacterium]|nr:hypothetical protein [Xanthobacteraceae bacterium]
MKISLPPGSEELMRRRNTLQKSSIQVLPDDLRYANRASGNRKLTVSGHYLFKRG